jgi:anti-sigma B factor antagonist
MQFELKKLDNGIKQIKLLGRMDLKGTNEIDIPFNAQVNTAKAPVLVDMSEVEFLASIGIRLLLSSARALDRRGGKMVLLKPQLMVEDILKKSEIDQLIPIYHDYDEACTALKTVVFD